MDHSIPRIDAHAHYIPDPYRKMLESRGIDKPDGYPLPTWDLAKQLDHMDKLCVEFAALTISSPHPHYGDAGESIEVVRASNEFGYDIARKYPDKLGIMATLPLPEVDASIDEIEFAVKEGALGFVMPTNAQGVYLGDERLDPVFDCLNRHKAVLCFHPTTPSAIPSDVLTNVSRSMLEFFFDTTRAVANMIVNGVVKRYPDITYIIPHGGAVIPLMAHRMNSHFTRFLAEENIDVFEVLRSFHYDLAGFVVYNQLDILLKTTTIDHLLYGTDAPHTTTENGLILAKALDETDKLTDEQRTLIYTDNAKKLFAM